MQAERVYALGSILHSVLPLGSDSPIHLGVIWPALAEDITPGDIRGLSLSRRLLIYNIK